MAEARNDAYSMAFIRRKSPPEKTSQGSSPTEHLPQLKTPIQTHSHRQTLNLNLNQNQSRTPPSEKNPPTWPPLE